MSEDISDDEQFANAQNVIDEQLEKVRRASPYQGLLHCLECGEEIPEGRRKANPKGTTCIECQELIEQGK